MKLVSLLRLLPDSKTITIYSFDEKSETTSWCTTTVYACPWKYADCEVESFDGEDVFIKGGDFQ